jgi:hypothetical protein
MKMRFLTSLILTSIAKSLVFEENIFFLYFWLDPKVPKDQGLIKISGFLRVGLSTRYKPLPRTGLRLLLYRLL